MLVTFLNAILYDHSELVLTVKRQPFNVDQDPSSIVSGILFA